MADHIERPPEDWDNVAMGAGQDPQPHPLFQVSDKDGSIRRHPDQGETDIVVIKPPERPY